MAKAKTAGFLLRSVKRSRESAGSFVMTANDILKNNLPREVPNKTNPVIIAGKKFVKNPRIPLRKFAFFGSNKKVKNLPVIKLNMNVAILSNKDITG